MKGKYGVNKPEELKEKIEKRRGRASSLGRVDRMGERIQERIIEIENYEEERYLCQHKGNRFK